MTNQVQNDTSHSTPELSEEERYDLEWESDGDSDQDPSSEPSSNSPQLSDGFDAIANERAEDPSPAARRTAGDDTKAPPQGSPPADHSGGQAADDIWAGATEAQRLAFLKAQNDFSSMSGRARAEQQRRADLEKELDQQKAALAQINRKKGTYETEHPELFDEVLQVLESKGQVSTNNTSTPQAQTKMDEDIKTVFKVHPDAQELLVTAEWASYTENLTDVQRQQLDSDDPYEFIDLVSSFKVDRAVRAATSAVAGSRQYTEEDLLDDTVTAAPGSSSRGPSRGAMSDEEAYEAEWAKDD